MKLDKRRKEAWDMGAKKDALCQVSGGSRSWTEEELFDSGAREAEEYTESFFVQMDFDPAGKRALEIGCGIGRTTRAFADMFGEVYGVDFSTAMIDKAKELNEGKRNLFFMTNNGVDLSAFEDNFFNCVFSFACFQHAASFRIIEGYIREIGRVLKPGGLFKFQVDGRKWAPVIPIIHRSLFNFLHKLGLVDKFARLYFQGDTTRQSSQPTILLSKVKLETMLRGTNLEVVEITGEDTCWMECSGYKRQEVT